MDVQAYLNRINYQGKLIPDLSLLKELQKKHILHIPFENLDIHIGKEINLDVSQIYDKIIPSHRGGFCYENNGLFYVLLEKLGFQVKRISARVWSEEKGYGQEFDHLAIICTLDDGDYLLDVGFGDFALFPLQLKLDTIQEDPHGRFTIKKHEGLYLKVLSEVKGEWKPAYIFSPSPREYSAFENMCHFHQYSPDSPFTQKRLCTIATESGRITLLNDRVKIKAGDLTSEQEINSEEDFHKKLKQYFQIVLPKAR